MKQDFKDILKSEGEPQKFELWKDQLGNYLKCNRNDMKCWTSLLPRLTCEIDDTRCWKKKMPHVPCEENDSKCWRSLLPHLPCKVEDHQCWKEIKSGKVLRNFNIHEQKIINTPPHADGFSPTSNFQRHYAGRKFEQSHVWIT